MGLVETSLFAVSLFGNDLNRNHSHQRVRQAPPPAPILFFHMPWFYCRLEPVRYSLFVPNSTLVISKQQVEVIDGHNLPKAPGQLSVNPYVVLTFNGEPFARSSSARGAAFPVWSSEVFMVKLPPPPIGEWHLTPQKYFQGYRSGTAQQLTAAIVVSRSQIICRARARER